MDRHSDMTELIGPDGIFLRTADRKRFDYVLRGVREDSLSLALSSDNDGLLDHYGRLMINKLRKSDGLQIEVFLPQNTEALLERFNQILADLSIDEARNAETSQAPRRVLLAHDAKAISERDLQLLSRLVRIFQARMCPWSCWSTNPASCCMKKLWTSLASACSAGRWKRPRAKKARH